MAIGGSRLAAVVAVLLLVTGCSNPDDPASAEPSPAGTATSEATSGSSSPGAGTAEERELRPDLTVLPATGLVIRGSGGARVLRFGTTLANVGIGPLVAIPDKASPCPPGQRSFEQVVSLDVDGDQVYEVRRDTKTIAYDGVCVLFHPTHEHWHIDGSARYSLRNLAGDEVVGTRKVSFCLRDSSRLRGPAGETGSDEEVYLDCARDRLQGISPGWGDLYDRELDGQTLTLPPGMADGRYCLRMTADPFDRFREVDERNNTSVTALRIRGSVVRVGGGWC